MSQANRSIVIAGAGHVGLAMGVALKQALGARISISICDPRRPGSSVADGRTSAVSAGSRRMLAVLGVWDELAPQAQPILDMIITDSRLDDPLRSPLLSFTGEAAPGEPFAYMIENVALRTALENRARALDVAIEHAAVTRWRPLTRDGHRHGTGRARIGAEEREASLLIAADGGRSRLREQAGIGWVGWGYRQSGLVATVAHAREHHGRAIQHFLPSGPFAILPLTGRRSSIVWTERADNAAALLMLDRDDQLAEVEQRFGDELGELSLETELMGHPLGFGIARRFVGDRLALIGEAAHVMHPLAGQGLNVGLRDAAVLAEEVTGAVRLGLDAGDVGALAAYERGRRLDAVSMGGATDVLNRLFSNDHLSLRLARDLGMGLVQRLPGLKRFLMREAAGLVGSQPRLMRGEAL